MISRFVSLYFFYSVLITYLLHLQIQAVLVSLLFFKILVPLVLKMMCSRDVLCGQKFHYQVEIMRH